MPLGSHLLRTLAQAQQQCLYCSKPEPLPITPAGSPKSLIILRAENDRDGHPTLFSFGQDVAEACLDELVGLGLLKYEDVSNRHASALADIVDYEIDRYRHLTTYIQEKVIHETLDDNPDTDPLADYVEAAVELQELILGREPEEYTAALGWSEVRIKERLAELWLKLNPDEQPVAKKLVKALFVEFDYHAPDTITAAEVRMQELRAAEEERQALAKLTALPAKLVALSGKATPARGKK